MSLEAILRFIFKFCHHQSMLRASLLPRHGASSGSGWRPPDLEGSCDYIE